MYGVVATFCVLFLLNADSVVPAGAAEHARWRVDNVLLEPGPADTFDEVAVKDPSIVCHEGRWHLFYTARSKKEYGIGYVSGERLAALASQPRRLLTQLRGVSSTYAAAPQVFFFRPKNTWFLVFQTQDTNYQPVFSTNENIGNPESWTTPQPLVQKTDPAKWIDFWVICDESAAYLFFTREHEGVWIMTTPLDRFPEGFSGPKEVFAPVHEAVHVYKVAGRAEYHMIYEMRDDNDIRHFGLARAEHLAGPWVNVADRFAAGDYLQYEKAGLRWTDEVSHGEFLRAGVDERLEYAPEHLRLLIQGMPRAEHDGIYPLLPWRLGIITRE